MLHYHYLCAVPSCDIDYTAYRNLRIRGWLFLTVDLVLYACMYVCMYVCTYVRTYVCMYVCVYVCMCACVCVFVCMYVCLSVFDGITLACSLVRYKKWKMFLSVFLTCVLVLCKFPFLPIWFFN